MKVRDGDYRTTTPEKEIMDYYDYSYEYNRWRYGGLPIKGIDFTGQERLNFNVGLICAALVFHVLVPLVVFQ